MADVFISYAREDRQKVSQLARALEAAGLSVWWDRDISGGAEFSVLIEQELNAATHVIVAWSKYSLGSHWVRDEAELAREENKLIPLSMDGVMPPLGFRQIHALPFDAWSGDHGDNAFKELVKALGPSLTTTTPGPTSAQFKRPGIAVLPFDNMSSDNEIEHVADGLTEDIISSLATIKHLQVPARNSVFVYKGKSTDIREVGDALDVRYVIEGSVRKLGPRVRITAQLIETETNAHLWADKFDVSLEEFYDNPDDVVERIAGTAFSVLVWAEGERCQRLPEEERGPWELCQLANMIIGRGGAGYETSRKCTDDLGKVVESFPDYTLAHAMFAWCCIAMYVVGNYQDGEEEMFLSDFQKHLNIARKQCDGNVLDTAYIAACENFSGQQAAALETLEVILKRNPSLGFAWFIVTSIYTYLGRFDDARRALDRADAVAGEGGFSPSHARFRGFNEYVAGNYDGAIGFLVRAFNSSSGDGYLNCVLGLCYHKTGDADGVRRHVRVARKHNPFLTPQKLQPIIMGQPDKEKAAEEYKLLVDLWEEAR